MRVNSNAFSDTNFAIPAANSKSKKRNLSFGINLKSLINTIPRAAREIETDLFQRYDIKANFQGNDLIANCVEKTTRIFAEIFDKDFLPQKVEFNSFEFFKSDFKNAFGLFSSAVTDGKVLKNIYVNSDYMRHHSDTLLTLAQMTDKFAFNYHSSSNPLHTFVHEFAHCAHFSNVLKKGNLYAKLRTLPLPALNDNIINISSIGKYANADDKVQELVAETLSRQILNYPETIARCDKSTLFKFFDVPDEKGFKYLQAAWDGDIEKLNDLTKTVHEASREQDWKDLEFRTDCVFAGFGL